MALATSIDPYMVRTADISGLTCSDYNEAHCTAGATTYNATNCEYFRKCENVANSTQLDAQRKATAEANVRYGDVSRQYTSLLLICLNLCIGIIFFLWLAWNYYV